MEELLETPTVKQPRLTVSDAVNYQTKKMMKKLTRKRQDLGEYFSTLQEQGLSQVEIANLFQFTAATILEGSMNGVGATGSIQVVEDLVQYNVFTLGATPEHEAAPQLVSQLEEVRAAMNSQTIIQSVKDRKTQLKSFCEHLHRLYQVDLYESKQGYSDLQVKFHLTCRLPDNAPVIKDALDKWITKYCLAAQDEINLDLSQQPSKKLKKAKTLIKTFKIPAHDHTILHLVNSIERIQEQEKSSTIITKKKLQYNVMGARINIDKKALEAFEQRGWRLPKKFQDRVAKGLQTNVSTLDMLLEFYSSSNKRVLMSVFKAMWKVKGLLSASATKLVENMEQWGEFKWTTFVAMMRAWFTMALATGMRSIQFMRFLPEHITDNQKVDFVSQQDWLSGLVTTTTTEPTISEDQRKKSMNDCVSWTIRHESRKTGNKSKKPGELATENFTAFMKHRDVRLDARFAMDEFLFFWRGLKNERDLSKHPFAMLFPFKPIISFKQEDEREVVLKWLENFCNVKTFKGSTNRIQINVNAEKAVAKCADLADLKLQLKAAAPPCKKGYWIDTLALTVRAALETKFDDWRKAQRKYWRLFNLAASFAITGGTDANDVDTIYGKDFNLHSVRALSANFALAQGCGKTLAQELGCWGAEDKPTAMKYYVCKSIDAAESDLKWFTAWRRVKTDGEEGYLPPNTLWTKIKDPFDERKRLKAIRKNMKDNRSPEWRAFFKL